MIVWNIPYDNLLPEDFVIPKPIEARCNLEALEEFLSSRYEDEDTKYERQLAKEGANTPSTKLQQ